MDGDKPKQAPRIYDNGATAVDLDIIAWIGYPQDDLRPCVRIGARTGPDIRFYAPAGMTLVNARSALVQAWTNWIESGRR